MNFLTSGLPCATPEFTGEKIRIYFPFTTYFENNFLRMQKQFFG